MCYDVPLKVTGLISYIISHAVSYLAAPNIDQTHTLDWWIVFYWLPFVQNEPIRIFYFFHFFLTLFERSVIELLALLIYSRRRKRKNRSGFGR